ncbi:MAG: tetratricopeptide repeat protein [Leptospiraceae bacterium]|nr:tetratricopeptide repeat protein [Leptospiraceae bacterium]
MINKTNAMSRFFAAGFLILLIWQLSACQFAPATRESNAQTTTVQVADPEKYNAAQAIVNDGNKLFMRGAYDAALAKANESLGVYETFEGYYLKGTVLYRQGKARESLQAYEKAEKLNPTDQQLLLTMGTVYTSIGELEPAQQRYLKLHGTYPDDPVYAFKVGTTYKNMRDYPKAYTYLKKADVDGFQYRDQVYLQLGDVCLELKKFNESEEYFAKAKQLNPALSDAARGGEASQLGRKLDEGNTAFSQGDYETALRHFNEAKRMAPDQAVPYLLAGSTLLAMERNEEARDNLVKAVEIDPRNPRGYSLLGSAYHQLRNYRLALKTLDTGLEIAPENYEMHNKRGLVYKDREELRKAIDSFYRSVQIKSDYVPGRTNLAFALLEDGRYADARREFEEASRLDPGNDELKKGSQLVEIYTRLDRGDRFVRNGRFQEALAEYEAAREIRDDQPVVYNSLGRAELARRNYRGAEANFQKALALDDKNVPALQGLIRVYSATRQRAQEQQTLARLQELTRNDITAAITLGRTKEDAGNWQEAERYYQELLKAQPEEKAVRDRLGYVYYNMGLEENRRERFQPALNYFEKAEEFNPQIPELPETLQVVRENIEYAAELPKLKRAEDHFRRGEFRAALPIFEDVYTRLQRSLILVKIANCYIALGEEQKGIQMLEDATRSGTTDVEISEAIYNHMLRKGDVQKARDGFQEIVNRDPSAYYSWYKLGVIDLMRKEFSQAIENFSRALIYKPDFAVGYIARGVALYENGDKEKARLEFEEALRQDRQASLASFNLGVFFFNENMVDRAKSVFEELLKEQPRFTDPRFQLSYIYFKQNNLEQAEKEIRECIRISPEARYYNALAEIYEKSYEDSRTPANAQKLRETYSEIIQRFPDSEYARRSREQMRTVMPDMRIVQPYPLPAAVRSEPVLYNSEFLLIEPRRVRAVDAGSKQVRWEAGFGADPMDILADHAVFTLFPSKVVLLDATNGERLGEFAVDTGGDANARLVGAFESIGVIGSRVVGRNRLPVLRVYDADGHLKFEDQAPSATTTYAYHGDTFIRLERAGNTIKMNRLAADGTAGSQSSIAFRGLATMPTLQTAAGKLYLYDGNELIIVSTQDLSETARLTLPAGTPRVDVTPGGRILVPAANEMTVYNSAGEQEARLRLPDTMRSRASFRANGEDRFLYVARDGKLYQMNTEGQTLWSVEIPAGSRPPRGSQVEEAFSVFY